MTDSYEGRLLCLTGLDLFSTCWLKLSGVHSPIDTSKKERTKERKKEREELASTDYLAASTVFQSPFFLVLGAMNRQPVRDQEEEARVCRKTWARHVEVAGSS